MSAAAVIVAAGSGQRFGSASKAFSHILGKPMAWWSLTAAANAAAIDEIVLVCGVHSQAAARAVVEDFDSPKPVRVVLGGARRQDSTLAGLASTSPEIDVVAIHDAARPAVTGALFDAAVQAARSFGSAIVAIPVADTIKRVKNDTVQETLPRDELVSVQTPQAFRKTLLLKAYAAAEEAGTTVTDEASLIEAHGSPVRVIPGSTENIKVTYPSDVLLVEAVLGARAR